MDRQVSDSSNGDNETSLRRIPKKKRFSATDDAAATDASIAADDDEPISSPTSHEGDVNTGEISPPEKAATVDAPIHEPKIRKKVDRSPKRKSIKSTTSASKIAPTSTLSSTFKNSSEKFDPPILRKGDLVRLSNGQKSGRIQGGLARIARSTYAEDDDDHAGEPTHYDIEYVLGGKVHNLKRCDLCYTTATAEGLVDATDNSRGHLLRRRRTSTSAVSDITPSSHEEKEPAAAPVPKGKKKGKESKKSASSTEKKVASAAAAAAVDGDAPTKRKGPGRPPGAKNKQSDRKRISDFFAPATSKKRRISSKSSDNESASAGDARSIVGNNNKPLTKSQAAKLGWEKRRNQEAAAAAAKTAAPAKATAKSAAKASAKLSRSSSRSSDAPSDRSAVAKLGWETRRKQKEAAARALLAGGGEQQPANNKRDRGKSASSRRFRKSNSATDASECSDANSSTAANNAEDSVGGPAPRRMDMYTRHRRELEKSISRLEKADRYSFFLDAPPPEFDENYDDDGDGDENDDDDENDGAEHSDHFRRVGIRFPQQPPFNFLVIRKRFSAGRYDLDMVALEQKRMREIKAMLGTAVTCTHGTNMDEQCDDLDYNELSKSMCNPIAVDWDTFNSDVTAMCDSAMLRDPQGVSLGAGHLGSSASKIKKLMEEIYCIYGVKRKLEVEESESRDKYGRALVECGNVEAAMQGNWRKEAFPERKYERLETSSVICDGLSDKDRSYAMYELETKLPDSFVGLAYTYDDSGQHSETWMKTVADETSSSQPTKPQRSKSKRKKKDAAEGESLSLASSKQSETKAQKAAMALAKDDGVVRAQVQTAMTTLLIQVQDRVMTDLGVMHNPEARSANWDDGDSGRDYRGGSAEVEQGTHSGFSLPEVAEQEVWGVDCYTRKNVMALIEKDFTPDIAIEFVEKWFLPAINACPVDLAHKMSTAARILEGLPPVAPTINEGKTKVKPPEDSASNPTLSEDATNLSSNDKQGETNQCSSEQQRQESSVFLRNAFESKIREKGPPWLKAAARIIRLASSSLDDDFFRIHPKGHGSVVIGARGLKANSLVTYYRGEVYPAWRWCEKLDAIEHVQKRLDLRPNLPDFYNMAMERPKKDPRGYCLLFVDASRKSGLGSSFSHSCNPTCEVRVVSLNGKLSLSMTTLRDLEQGEELTFDYNAVTESLNEYRFAVCLCGQKNCRGSFLHYATAECYQQVLSRNSPISARFANLVRGCMKQVMSKEDSELLLKHGFNTAAFGAVSFNHHVNNADDPQSSPDSIENVPIWLRTYVADCLRYIEYERRALPVALLCNQMERMEKKQQGKLNIKNTAAIISKRERQLEHQPSYNESSSSEKDKSKAISGSKPKTSYFFFLQSQRDFFGKIAKKQHEGVELKGLDLSRAINTLASQAWAELAEEEKLMWKKKSIADWKKKGGKEKARLEEERQRLLRNGGSKEQASKEKAPKETSKISDKQKSGAAIEDEENSNGSRPSASNNDLPFEAKTISFADADAEGCSAMEQRIQQLAQSLSRVGRVLDRHRESVFAERKECENVTTVGSDLLRKLVSSPLKIMSDEEVVSSMWSDPKGVVRALFMMVKDHFPHKSLLLRGLLSSAEKCYPVLSAFNQNYLSQNSHLEKKFKHSCTSSDARRLLREALLKFRRCIIDFLSFAEKSHAEDRNEKRREQARAREKKKLKETKVSEATSMPLEASHSNVEPPLVNTEDPSMQISFQSGDSKISPEYSANNLGNEAMPIRGGGGESTDPPNGLSNLQILGQSCTLKPLVGPEPSNGTSIGVNAAVLTPPLVLSSTDANHVQEPSDRAKGEPPIVQHAVRDDVTSLLQMSQGANHVGTIFPENTTSSQNCQACTDIPIATTASENPTEKSIQSPSRLQDLINAVASNNDGVVDNTSLASKETLLVNGQNDSDTLNPPFTLPEAPLSAPSTPATPSVTSSETKKAKKKVVPLSEEQLKYLKNWLFDPKHILNPYPTDEEKNAIMKDTGIKRKRLDGWFMKNRQRVLHPDVQPVKMKWTKLDQDHWAEFRKNRYMLEATADLLLMYASTNTFFLLQPFRQFDSTPIEVYARELGNEVPRRFALNCKNDSGSDEVQKSADSDGDVVMENSSCDEEVLAGRAKNCAKKIKKRTESADDDLCSLDDVIDKVTVDYSGDYVLSQLLQWVNGGIGQKKGLPEIYGCVMLPPVPGCWDEVKCNEVKLPNYTKWNRKTTTEYAANVRSKLAGWFLDRYRRGSAWEEDVAKYFCPLDQGAPDPTMPMGSPVLDYLVTGIDENIRHVSATLSGCVNMTEQGRSKLSASDRLQSTVDEGMPAQAVANWVQCENPDCLKWRKLPWHVDVDLLPENFFCKDNIWNPKSQKCEAPEDEWDMEDAPIKFDTSEDNFEVGAWFDVQREGKVSYHEAQITELDFESNVKRVKFHFWKLSSDRDEWVDVGCPRIAPHHSYTPRPLDGYKAPKKKNNSDKNKVSNTDKEKGSNTQSPSDASGILPQKRKIDNLPPSNLAEGTTDELKKTLPFPQSTIDYLNKWVTQHAANPFPTTDEKEVITAATGLSKRQVGDWMARARKKLRKKPDQFNKTPAQDKGQTAERPSVDVAAVKNVPRSPTKVENLLLALRNPLPPQGVPFGGIEVVGNADQTTVQEVPSDKVGNSVALIEVGGDKRKMSIKEIETFMKAWLSRPENVGNFMPTLAQKESIIQETGIEKKRLEGWFFRARKKLKKQHEHHQARPHDSQASQPPHVMSESTISVTNAVTPKSPHKAPTVQHKQLLKKPSVTHVLPTGINKPATEASKLGESIPTPSSKAMAANKTTSLMKMGKPRQDMSITPPKPGEPSQNTSISLTKASAPDLVISSTKSGKISQNESTSLSSSPAKGLSEDAKTYLARWLSEHASNPYPSREEKSSLMSALGIANPRGMRMLDGWFCRARKKLKESNNTTNPNLKINESNESKENQPVPSPRSSLMASSNFASLLSAATSELGPHSLGSSPKLHDSRQPERATLYQPMEGSRFPGEDESMIQGSQHPHETQMPPSYEAQHSFTHSGDRKLGAREQAILSSFQSLQSVEIHDRDSSQPSRTKCPPHQQPQSQQGAPRTNYSPHQQPQVQQGAPHTEYTSHRKQQGQHRATPSNHSSHKQPQGHLQAHPAVFPPRKQPQGQNGAPPSDYSSYQQPQGHQQAPPAKFPTHQQLKNQKGAPPTDYLPYQQPQGHQQAPPVKYSAHQQLQGQQGAPPADYPPYQHLEGHQQAPPTKYRTHQHLQDHQQAPPAEYASYQRSQSQHGAPPDEYPTYQHSQDQHQVPPNGYSSYQHSQGQHQAPPPVYSSYQRPQGQHQAPPVDYSPQGQRYIYTSAGGNPSTYEGDPNGSHPPTYEGASSGPHPQRHGFHQGHTSYGQPHNSTYQH